MRRFGRKEEASYDHLKSDHCHARNLIERREVA